jgi:hypothetical protein
MSQLANRTDQMIVESNPKLKPPMRPLMRPRMRHLMKPGFRKPRSKKVSWSDNLITEYIFTNEILKSDVEHNTE